MHTSYWGDIKKLMDPVEELDPVFSSDLKKKKKKKVTIETIDAGLEAVQLSTEDVREMADDNVVDEEQDEEDIFKDKRKKKKKPKDSEQSLDTPEEVKEESAYAQLLTRFYRQDQPL